MSTNSIKKLSLSILVAVLSIPMSGGAWADGANSYPLSPLYKEECGSCHVAYPAALLSTASWQALMAGLDRHFGTDASIDKAKAQEIGIYLQANAARQQKYVSADAQGRALLRISESEWFQREHRAGHDGLSAAVWKLPSVKSPANCGACHQGAEQGRYAEREISIPHQ